MAVSGWKYLDYIIKIYTKKNSNKCSKLQRKIKSSRLHVAKILYTFCFKWKILVYNHSELQMIQNNTVKQFSRSKYNKKTPEKVMSLLKQGLFWSNLDIVLLILGAQNLSIQIKGLCKFGSVIHKENYLYVIIGR